ncbi:hypothetical protein [Kribbella sp. VKM Ac-2566]|uniref:hypothetical protein n=1 Tax=Kribbella sp. VKM Ac-2566 TaxID=2512218 RepID=UPI00106392B3|nr:hypothetical protein [Kribbella sp. VKM Ac-2566]TDW92464.1 hypothetical protein EV647_4303 [Kribbella sp. VKM Ac-2566]
MRRRKLAVTGLIGFVLGALIATVIVVLVTRDDSAAGTSAEKTGKSSASAPPSASGTAPVPSATPVTAKLPKLNLSAVNRRAPVPGLPDWSKAGYREGAGLPDGSKVNPDQECKIGADRLASEYGVKPDDSKDDSDGLQKAIDAIRAGCSEQASYDKLSLIELPAGQLDVSKQLGVDADYLIIRGAGADKTHFVFRPDENTRYDALTKDGGDWDEDGMEFEDGTGGWLWPGRGLFRVQSRGVDPDYQAAYEKAPANRKDLFEGTVNVHWKAGLKLREKPGGAGFAAKAGDTVIYLDEKAKLDTVKPGGYVNVRAANTMKFYEQQQALPTEHELQNLHMRQQIFTVNAVDEAQHTVTIDKPLEYDVPVDSTSDGSEKIENKSYASKLSPLVDPVLGVGLENFSLTQPVDAKAADAVHNYGNLAPADELHGVVLKWAVNSWVRGIRTTMTGSHAIVTEEAKNLQIQDNVFDGAWNKGKGGNGYLRGSRVWDSVYAGNISRGLRHLTLQWSASGNVVIGNDLDSDLNLHGGWERRNLFELNTVHVPYEHRSANCRSNCGGEGGEQKDESTWYPIWWGAGPKAVKWSGATGPQNVFFNNTLTKQAKAAGPYQPYLADAHTIYQFGWNGTTYQHLTQNTKPIPDWAGHEQDDFTKSAGVDATKTDPGQSLFLRFVG